VVYHLAAKVTTPFAHNDPHSFEQVNQWGTAELSYLLEQNPVKAVIYTSSMSVYGSGEGMSEQSEADPDTYYGISKKLGEDMLLRLMGGPTKIYILRCGNVFGFNRSVRFDAVINKFMFEAHFKGKITVKGNGIQRRAFLHLSQLRDTLNRLVECPIPEGVYNLVTANYTVNDIALIIKDLYPDLEMQHVQQSLTMQSQTADLNPKIAAYHFYKEVDLKEALQEFRSQMAFEPIR
jgi:UDP-glucose 4-epimerase